MREEKQKIILVTGGVRSGKSRFAQELVTSFDENVRYIATAEAKDEEMKKRVHMHKLNRPATWPTVEEPIYLAEHFSDNDSLVTLLDCVTIWVSNMLIQNNNFDLENWESDEGIKLVEKQVDEFVSAIKSYPNTIVIVTNEVGWGGIAMSPLGRVYQDILGWTNQKIAAVADEVFLVAAGIPIKLKGSNGL